MLSTTIKRYLLVNVMLVTVFLTSSRAQTGQAYDMMVDGVKVIVQPSGNEIVEIQTILKGGVQNYPAGKDGIESLAITALTECGTAHDDKNSFKNKLDKVSARMNGYSAMDYASFSLNCIKDDLDAVWPLYVDALTIPAFDAKEFERIKQDAVNSLRMQASDPDYAISKYARQTAFAGKNYAKMPEGTEATVSKLTAAETKTYYKKILTKSRLVIVVVGEIERAELEQKIKTLLAPIPKGAPFVSNKDIFMPANNSFHAAKKDFATNYIQAVSGAPAPGTPDFNAFVLAMRIFSDRQFLEVRTNHGLSYAPYSYFDGGLSPSANIFVSTTDPNKYIDVMNDLLNRTRKEGFTEEEVKNMKTTYITNFYYRLETNDAQAASLAANEVLHNNWRRSLTINQDMKKVTREDLNRVFNKYVNKFAWVYQGDPAKVNAVLYTGSKEPVRHASPASKLGTQKKN